jgi:alpha-glucosidase
MLTLYRKLIGLRRAYPALMCGSYRAAPPQDNVLLYERHHEDQRLLVVLNFESVPKEVTIPCRARERVLLSTYMEPPDVSARMILRPDEGVVVGAPHASGHGT